MKTLEEIKDSFLDNLIILRTFYMSSLIENELAKNLIEKYKHEGTVLKSKYRSEDDKFIFGQGNDGYLNTKVEVNECIYMITRSNEKTKM